MAFDFTISSSVLSHIGKAYSAKLSGNSEPKFIIDHNTCYEENLELYNYLPSIKILSA